MPKIGTAQFALALIVGIPAIAATPQWIQQRSGLLRDAQGNVYVVGSVSTDIVPITPGAFQPKFNAGTCGSISSNPFGGGSLTPVPCRHGFAAKISSDGSQVLYATYIEGSQDEDVSPVGVDSSGNLFIRVNTSSVDFPATGSIPGLPPVGNGGGFYILQLSSDGGRLLFSDAFGFPGYQSIGGVSAAVLLPDGKLVFGGTTDGTAFPTTPGAYLHARPNVSLDGFVFEWDPKTNSIVHSTLIGGSDQDRLTGLVTDTAGNVYVTGYSISQDFPVSPGAFNSPGPPDARVNVFVAKLDASLSTLDFSLMFGGSYHPIPNAIALDSSGNVYIDGWGSRDLPVNPGAFETSFADGFLAKFDGKKGARIYLTYLADGHVGVPGPLAVNSDGSVWVAGRTQYGGVVTTPDALEPSLSNIYLSPPYLKHISTDGSQQLYGTYLAEFLAFVAPGVTLVSDSTSFFRIHDFNLPSQPPKPPLITSIVNTASMSQPDFIAPGEIVSIFGLSIGPDQPVAYKLDSTGRVSSNIDGLQVLIDGIAAPILSASKNQINVVVPFSMALPPTYGSIFDVDASVQLSSPGNTTPLMLTATKVSSLPGIFASDNGVGLILNQDATINGPPNPASQGSTISLFVTGLGPMTPAPVDGAFATTPLMPTLPIQVFLGTGSTRPYTLLDAALVKYAGDAPGQIVGLQQINVQLPTGAVFSSLYIKAGAGLSNAVVFFEQ